MESQTMTVKCTISLKGTMYLSWKHLEKFPVDFLSAVKCLTFKLNLYTLNNITLKFMHESETGTYIIIFCHLVLRLEQWF